MKTTPATYIDDAINRWRDCKVGLAIYNRCPEKGEWDADIYIESVEIMRKFDDAPQQTVDQLADVSVVRMMASPWNKLSTPAARLKVVFREDFE